MAGGVGGGASNHRASIDVSSITISMGDHLAT